MTPEERARLETVEREIRALRRDLEAGDRRTLSDAETRALAAMDSLKRHVDLSNAASLRPYVDKITHIETSVGALLARDENDRKLAQETRDLLAKINGREEAAKEVERRADLARTARESRSRAVQPWLVFAGVVLTVCAALGGAALNSWSRAASPPATTRTP